MDESAVPGLPAVQRCRAVARRCGLAAFHRRLRAFCCSLHGRILLALLIALALGYVQLAYYLHDNRDELRRSVMLMQAQEIAGTFTLDTDPAVLPARYAGGELFYTLYDERDHVVWRSANLTRPQRLRPAMPPPTWFSWGINSGRVVSVPVALPGGGTLMVAKRDERESALITTLLQERLRHGLVLMVPLALGSLLLVLLLLYWSLQPVRRATELAQGIGPRHPARRLPEPGLPVEIRPLAQAANQALDRLAQAYEGERRFVADAAHELRTPLAVLDLRLQQAQRHGDADWPAIRTEMRQMCRLVEQLLELARQEGPEARAVPAGASNLSRVVRESAAALTPLYEAEGRTLEVTLPSADLWSGAEAGQLSIALRNVLENARLHGRGRVRLSLREDGPMLALDVTDDGEGVPPAQQEAMFQRFRKGRAGSGGTGLGLAIVRQIMRNAGGDARFVSAVPSRLRLTLPGRTLTAPSGAGPKG